MLFFFGLLDIFLYKLFLLWSIFPLGVVFFAQWILAKDKFSFYGCCLLALSCLAHLLLFDALQSFFPSAYDSIQPSLRLSRFFSNFFHVFYSIVSAYFTSFYSTIMFLLAFLGFYFGILSEKTSLKSYKDLFKSPILWVTIYYLILFTESCVVFSASRFFYLRYSYPTFFLFIFLGVGFFLFSFKQFIYKYKIVYFCIFCLLALSASFTYLNFNYSFYPEIAKKFDIESERHHLKQGAGGYWQSYPFQFMTKTKPWITYLWPHSVTSPYGSIHQVYPSNGYDFFIIDKLEQEANSPIYRAMKKINGEPDEVIWLDDSLSLHLYKDGRARLPSLAEMFLTKEIFTEVEDFDDKLVWKGSLPLEDGNSLLDVRYVCRYDKAFAVLIFSKPLDPLKFKSFYIGAVNKEKLKKTRTIWDKIISSNNYISSFIYKRLIPLRKHRIMPSFFESYNEGSIIVLRVPEVKNGDAVAIYGIIDGSYFWVESDK